MLYFMYHRIRMDPGLVVVWSLLLTVVLSEGKTMYYFIRGLCSFSFDRRYVHVEQKVSQV